MIANVKKPLEIPTGLQTGVMSWCISILCFRAGNGHYLLLLSQCDNRHAKAALLSHPQEMNIQCVCVSVYECVWNPSNFPFRWAVIGEQRQSQCPLLRRCSSKKEKKGREGHFRRQIWKCRNSPLDRATHRDSPHVRLVPQEGADGGEEGGRESPPTPYDTDSSSSSSSSWPQTNTDLINTRTCKWSCARTYVRQCRASFNI